MSGLLHSTPHKEISSLKFRITLRYLCLILNIYVFWFPHSFATRWTRPVDIWSTNQSGFDGTLSPTFVIRHSILQITTDPEYTSLSDNMKCIMLLFYNYACLADKLLTDTLEYLKWFASLDKSLVLKVIRIFHFRRKHKKTCFLLKNSKDLRLLPA